MPPRAPAPERRDGPLRALGVPPLPAGAGAGGAAPGGGPPGRLRQRARVARVAAARDGRADGPAPPARGGRGAARGRGGLRGPDAGPPHRLRGPQVAARRLDGAGPLRLRVRPRRRARRRRRRVAPVPRRRLAEAVPSGAASTFALAADKNLVQSPAPHVADATALAPFRGDWLVAAARSGDLLFPANAFPAGAAGAAALATGEGVVLVALPDRLDVWAVADEASDGVVSLAPLARLGLDAAPTSLCPSADGALGLVATAAGSLWYFNNTASHDEEFLAED